MDWIGVYWIGLDLIPETTTHRSPRLKTMKKEKVGVYNATLVLVDSVPTRFSLVDLVRLAFAFRHSFLLSLSRSFFLLLFPLQSGNGEGSSFRSTRSNLHQLLGTNKLTMFQYCLIRQKL